MAPNSEVPVQYSPGLPRVKSILMWGFLVMTAGFIIALIPGSKLEPKPEYCPDGEAVCKRGDLFAFEFICGSVFLCQSLISLRAWHFSDQFKVPSTPESRVFGYNRESEKLAAFSFVFQTWDFFVTPFIPEFLSTVMMGHHFMAALVSWFAFQHQFYHYYVVFFLAMTEVSSIPLVFISLSKYFSPTPGGVFATLVEIAGPLFAVTFYYYRVILWWKVSYRLWADAYYVLTKGIAEKYRPGKVYALYLILVINAVLGLLQLYWFSLILKEVAKLAGVE